MNIGDTLSSEWKHLTHHDIPLIPTAQETPVTRITDARAAIAHADAKLAEMAGNALAEAIADAGLGTHFADPEIRLVLGLVSAIEHGPQGVPVAPADGSVFPPVQQAGQ